MTTLKILAMSTCFSSLSSLIDLSDEGPLIAKVINRRDRAQCLLGVTQNPSPYSRFIVGSRLSKVCSTGAIGGESPCGPDVACLLSDGGRRAQLKKSGRVFSRRQTRLCNAESACQCLIRGLAAVHCHVPLSSTRMRLHLVGNRGQPSASQTD